MAKYRLDCERGVERRVSAQEATSRVRELLNRGWLITQIAAAADINRHTISNLAGGKQRKILPEHEERVLAVAGPPPSSQDMDGTGTQRRLQALCAMGYSLASLATEVGVSVGALRLIARGEQATVRSSTAAAVARVYRQCSRIPGPSSRARSMAARRGWHSPVAWDGHTIDDPAAEPDVGDESDLTELSGVRLLEEEIRHLDGYGLSVEQIAKQLDRNPIYVGMVRRAYLRRTA